ncbi:MAG: DUF1882 domain-containing protein [Capnocytophaga sp.]|nr:MAG: DUF1882 domain-containing protein [Capnocytophaga sp.]
MSVSGVQPVHGIVIIRFIGGEIAFQGQCFYNRFSKLEHLLTAFLICKFFFKERRFRACSIIEIRKGKPCPYIFFLTLELYGIEFKSNVLSLVSS